MNDLWVRELMARGGRFEAGEVHDFGAPEAERDALSTATTLHPLGDCLLLAQGEDAAPFLQGQLTSDILALTPERAHYSAYCTAKGRVLATLLVSRTDTGFLLQLPAGMGQTVAQRLRKFVLRARVKLTDASDRGVLLGVGGPEAGVLVAAVMRSPPRRPLEVVVEADLRVWALEDGCFQLLASPARAVALWDRLACGAKPAGAAGWRWRRIQAGVPWVGAPTQELFVPQMADLDRVGAVSFTKGCYPGQEVVARAQYRGEVKRRLYRGHTAAAVEEGQALYRAGEEAQPAGIVANAAPAPGGGSDLLAVVQLDAMDSAALRLATAGGAPVLLERVAPIQAA